MSENNISWFHCGRCGVLFQSQLGDLSGRLCPECGRNPSLGFDALPAPTSMPRTPAPSDSDPALDPGRPHERHSLRRRKKNYFMLKLLLGWSALLVLIIYGARWKFHDNSENRKPVITESQVKTAIGQDEIHFINETAPLCNQAFAGFLNAGTPEERNQFVLDPINTASRMARFYSLNPMTNIDPSTLTLQKTALLNLPSGKALETIWTSKDDLQLDAVFINEGDEWRLDWDHFVRFSDYPWALFLAGSGEPQGEFRLLARERLADERKNSDTLSIVLYAPRFGTLNDTGLQSPEFLIKRDTENGRLLDAAFKLEKNGERVFGVKIENTNPESLIRLRVKVRRIEENMERRFELEKVVACHWYSSDEPGVQVSESPAPQPLEK
ncbi:MAG: hypothetical protein ABI600_05230 [Luteolibacter sp.]